MKLNSFNLYERLKSYHNEYLPEPFLLVNQDSYRKAAITFPFRTFTYGIGITYKGDGGLFKIGGVEYETKKGSLITVGPGIASQWLGNCNALHDTIYFTEELFKNSLRSTVLNSLPFFIHGGKHVIQLNTEKMNNIRSVIDLIKSIRNNKEAVAGLVYTLVQLTAEFHNEEVNTRMPAMRKKHTHSYFNVFKAHQAYKYILQFPLAGHSQILCLFRLYRNHIFLTLFVSHNCRMQHVHKWALLVLFSKKFLSAVEATPCPQNFLSIQYVIPASFPMINFAMLPAITSFTLMVRICMVGSAKCFEYFSM